MDTNNPDLKRKKELVIARSLEQKKALIEALTASIVNGTLEPGSPLRQEEIAEQFSVSRMPVREAFIELEAKGLLKLVPNSGAFVPPLEKAELRENFEMRAAAECLALRIAIPEISNRQLDEALEIHEQMQRCKLDEYIELNNRFHIRLYSPSHRPRLLAHIETLNVISARYIRLNIGHFQYTARSNDEHATLLDSCKIRDVENSVRILGEHITCAGENLEREFFKLR